MLDVLLEEPENVLFYVLSLVMQVGVVVLGDSLADAYQLLVLDEAPELSCRVHLDPLLDHQVESSSLPHLLVREREGAE